MRKKTKTHVQIAGVALLLGFVLIYLFSDSGPQDTLSMTEPELGADVVSGVTDEVKVTAPELEADVEIGTDGVVVAVDMPEAGVNEFAVITLKTDANTLYTVAVPIATPSPCESLDAIAEVALIVPGDKIGVRGKTDGENRIVPCDSEFHQLKIQGAYENPDVGLTFYYQKSPDGYRLDTEGYEFSTDPLFVTGALLMNKSEAEELLSSVEPREAPPATTLRVYQNPEGLSPEEWAEANPSETYFERALAEPAEISVGLKDAIGYTVDGLYLIDVYVVTYGEYALVITGEYMEYESEPFHDIERLVRTIVFTG
jgi:hypothetical protein